MATTRRSLAGPSLPETFNPFTQQRVPAYLVRGANPFTNNLNDPLMEAQHNFAGPGPAALTAAMRKQGLSFGSLGSSGSTSRPGGRLSLAAPSAGGSDDAARSGILNAYLSELANENAQRPDNAPLDAVEAELRDMRTSQDVKRASAIANTPGVSAQGRPIAGQDGSYATAQPTGQEPPVNRQALAAQMAPGLIAPPAPPKPLTFDAPFKSNITVNGKTEQTWVRQGSDGQIYDMSRRPITDKLTPPDAVSTTNANAEDKMIEAAATNILNNPRDLTSIRNITSLRGDQRLKLFNTLKEKNPDFNVGNIDRQIKFLDSYEDPKGRAATNRGSMNNILMHAADLTAANENYRRSNIRLVNMPIAALMKQGGTTWQQFATPLAVLKDEIGLYFAGGYAPTAEQGKTWDRIVNDTATPAQVEEFAKNIAHVGLRRANTHNEQFKTMMGYDDPNLITPEAKLAAERIGMGEEVKKYGSGGMIGAKDKGGTVEFIAPDGGILDVPADEVAAFTKAHPTVKRKG